MTTLLSGNIQLKKSDREKMRQQKEDFFRSGGKITTPEFIDRTGYDPAYRLNQQQRKSTARTGINHINR